MHNKAIQPTLVPRAADGWRYAGESMLKFIAKSTSYQEALDGEIVQIGFEQDPDDDPLNPQAKSICASINYEFPPCDLFFEWTDGPKFEGGLRARKYEITRLLQKIGRFLPHAASPNASRICNKSF